jgi:hypothetical protein
MQRMGTSRPGKCQFACHRRLVPLFVVRRGSRRCPNWDATRSGNRIHAGGIAGRDGDHNRAGGTVDFGSMRTRLIIAILLLLPVIARANPVMIDGQSAIAFGIVAFWALVIESAIATFALVSSGLLIVSSFGTFVFVNAVVFLVGFLPLCGQVSLWLLEPGVVLVDAVALKLLTCAPFLQGDSFIGISWPRAFLASLLGNAASLFVGVLASGTPWIVHESGALQ